VRGKKSGSKAAALQMEKRRAGKMPALRNAKRDALKRAPTTAARLRRRALRVLIRPPADPRRTGTDGREEFAGDEGVGGAEAGGELGGGQTAVVVEAA
jgi:hypothetical protein